MDAPVDLDIFDKNFFDLDSWTLDLKFSARLWHKHFSPEQFDLDIWPQHCYRDFDITISDLNFWPGLSTWTCLPGRTFLTSILKKFFTWTFRPGHFWHRLLTLRFCLTWSFGLNIFIGTFRLNIDIKFWPEHFDLGVLDMDFLTKHFWPENFNLNILTWTFDMNLSGLNILSSTFWPGLLTRRFLPDILTWRFWPGLSNWKCFTWTLDLKILTWTLTWTLFTLPWTFLPGLLT